MLVGGHAVTWHGYSRYTGDIDFFYKADLENARRLYAALVDFWGGDVPHVRSAEDLAVSGVFVHFGVVPNRVDLLSRMGSVVFDEAWTRRVVAPLEGEGWEVPLPIVGLEDLLQAKRDAGRPKDVADLAVLTRPI